MDVRRQEKKIDRKIVGINMGLLCLVTRYKNFLSQKEVQIKISSVLNVSNGSSKPEEFSLKDIEVLVDNKEQTWFKRAHTGQFLGIARIITSTAKLSKEDIRSRAFLQAKREIHGIDSIALIHSLQGEIRAKDQQIAALQRRYVGYL